MKSFLLMTGSGPLVVLTSYTFIEDTALLEALQLKGIDKFVAYEVPVELAKERYGGHYTAVINDWLETDDLRVLDFNGERAFRLFDFSELGEARIHEP
ncbi:MAG: cytosolic protein [Gammaproteobacteria bacterium]|nr:cytosolic protein [Gammaproteobacteria bacterium]